MKTSKMVKPLKQLNLQILKSGDLVALGQQGAEFVYESEPLMPPTVVHPASFASNPDNTVISRVNTTAGSVRRTQTNSDELKLIEMIF
jgi:hypothetical protein